MTSTRHATSETRRRQVQPHLTPAQAAHLRLVLIEQRDFRVEQLAALSHPDDGGPLGGHDREVVASLASGAHSALRDVRAALRRIEAGTYGGCTSCGEPLELRRLAAVPQIARCAGCQQQDSHQ